MRALFTSLLLLSLPLQAQEFWAITSETNVIGVAQVDPARFKLTAGTTNVVITQTEAGIVGPGWRFSGGVFTMPDGKPIANGEKARITRAKLIDAAIAKLKAMQASGATAVASWAGYSAAQKDTAQKLTIDAAVTQCRILELMLTEQRALLEIKAPE